MAPGHEHRLSGRLQQLFSGFPERGSALALWLPAHPIVVMRVFRLLGALPRLCVAPTGSDDGRALAAGLRRRSAIGRAIRRGATSVLDIRKPAVTYSTGIHRRTLRKKRNDALRRGVRWRSVDDPVERSMLLEMANEREASHPDARYRTDQPDNRDLLPLAGWWAATAAEGRPLLLAVAAVDGRWALLRYFRTLTDDPAASAARYLMTEVIVMELEKLDVHHLVTDMSPVRMSHGLRQFQHRVGFELRRVRVQRSSR